MTTPRDDIAGLSERLRNDAVEISGWGAGNEAARVIVAATQLDALLKERDELYQRLDAAAQMDREKTVRVVDAEARADALQARVKELEQQTSDLETLKNLYRKDCKEAEASVDSLSARVKELESLYDRHTELLASEARQITNGRTLYDAANARAEAAEARATRLQQERDEAYERAANAAENPGFIEAQDTDWDLGVNFAKSFIAAAIRRLAYSKGSSGQWLNH